MSELTQAQVASIYSGALQSVELLKRGEPVGFAGDWSEIEQANKNHLQIVLGYDCWTDEDLTPLQAASTAECPRDVQPVPPTFNVLAQVAAEGYPTKQGGQWTQTWVVSDLSAEQSLANAKAARAGQVGAITVTTPLGTFDGNEDAQRRMTSAITAMDDGDTLPWVLHDSTIVVVNKADLRLALRMAGAAMAAIWVAPYTQP